MQPVYDSRFSCVNLIETMVSMRDQRGEYRADVVADPDVVESPLADAIGWIDPGTRLDDRKDDRRWWVRLYR